MGVHDLSDPRINLDLSSPLWALKKGQASEVFGLDVVSPNRFKPDPWRRPVGVSIPVADRPLTSVIPVGTKVTVPTRITATHRLGGSTVSFIFFLRLADASYINSGVGAGQVIFADPGETPLLNYVFRTDDVLLIHSPSALRGAHPIRSKVDQRIITIDAGLGVDASDNLICALVQGEQLINHILLTNEETGVVEDWIVKSKELYDKQGSWPAACVDVTMNVNADARKGTSISPVIRRVDSYAQIDDALVFDLNATVLTDADESKVSVICTEEKDVRGFVVTNGRKFWLQQNGAYTLLLDLEDDDFLGTVWKGAQIATNRLMLVSPDFAPRILHLNRDGTQVLSAEGDEILAGCLPPNKPNTDSFDETKNIRRWPSWLMERNGNEDITAGASMRVLVRGVNLQDNLVSKFVPVFLAAGLIFPTTVDGINITILDMAEGNGASVFTVVNRDDVSEGAPPVIHRRITHIELWRTQSAVPSAFYLENRMEIVDYDRGEGVDLGSPPVDRVWFEALVPGTQGGGPEPLVLSDTDLIGLPVATDTILNSGGLPPVCRDIISFRGITFCFGRASEEREKPVLHARNFYSNNAGYDTSTGGIADGNYYTNYNFLEGDQAVVVWGGHDSAGSGISVPIGVYEITAATETIITIDKDLIPAGTPNDKMLVYIRRPYPIEWPHIESDEDVWYSRTDAFEPENFLPRILRLSETGDTFRRVIPVGNYLVIIMDQGVHLIFMDGITPVVDTIAVQGAGTAWPDSVLVFENVVYWASSQGIRKMTVSNQPDELGHRARLSLEGQAEYLDFFREAELNGDTVDAGIDTKNGTMRFRRRSPDSVTAGSLSGFLNSVERNAEGSEDTVLDL